MNRLFPNAAIALVTAVSLAGLSSNAIAADKKSDKKTAAHADKAEVYKIDTKASTITWTAYKQIGSSHTGNINFKDGTLDAKGETVTGGMFTVDMTSLTDTDLAGNPEYQAKLTGHLKSEDFFNVAKHPTSVLKITSMEKTGGSDYKVKGDLTMIGVTKPIEFPAKAIVTKDGVTGDASIKIKRTDWGLKYGSSSFFKELAGDKIIKDEFELLVKFVAKK